MSFNSSKTSTKAQNQSTSTFGKTTTPIMPDWLAASTKGLADKVTGLAGTDPSQYVAGPNALQGRGGALANVLGDNTGWYDQLMGTKAPTVAGASYLDGGMDKHMNPFLGSVVDSSLADFDFDAGKAKAQETLNIADQDGFGGSGSALTRSFSEGERARARGALDSGLRKDGYEFAANMANMDADRSQAASLANQQAALQQNDFLAKLGLDKSASDRDNAKTVMDIGGQFRDITQQQATAPLDLASWAAETFGSLPTNMFVGEDSSGTTNTSGTSSSKGKSSGFSVNAADIAKIMMGMG
jgi:hypothetical protein